MKIQARTGKDSMTGRVFCRGVVLICENDGESRLLDEAFGSRVDADGKIAVVAGEVKLSDGCGDHYIWLKKWHW
jgi:hypothetical protein